MTLRFAAYRSRWWTLKCLFLFSSRSRHTRSTRDWSSDVCSSDLDPKWQRAEGRLFLGIDHTAIVVASTDASLRFYRDLLGLRIAGTSLNYGPEQERLNNVPGARLRITSLRAPTGPGIEFLEYVSPRDGRPAPADERANDLVHWQTIVASSAPEPLAARLTAAGARLVSPGVVRAEDRALGFDPGFLVRGPDGHDKEINAAEYGEAPEGSPFLTLGHESFGVVEEVGARVTELMVGDYVVATVRRPGMSIYDRIGTSDMTTDDVYFERGISRRHGSLTEHYVEDPEFLVKMPQGLRDVGVLLEPTTVVEKGIAQAFEIQRRLRVWRPKKAAVIGAGTIGLLATLALRLRGLDVTTFARQRRPYLN